MDIDQIWEQIQLCNKPLIKYVNELPLEEEKRKHIDQDSEEEEEENELESDQDSDLSDDDHLGNDPIDMESNQQNINEENDSENDSEEEDDEEREEKLEDDPFFDYDEMEAFIEDGERRAELGSEADDEEFLEYLNKSNLDQENSDDDEMNDEEDSEDSEDGGIDWEKMKEGKEIEKITDIRYDDFFEPPKLSKHQQNKEKLGKKIQELEDINIADKPWQLQGEISSKQRPKDSLLEEFVIFDHATKTAPVITVEKTHDLEDIIKQRIRDESWDDVIPRRISNDLQDNKKKLDELDHEKSKHGLAEVYERQYLGLDAEEAEQKAKEKYDEITTLFNSLSYKLDALSNFNFTPNRKKKSTDEKKKDVPAINLEEKLPSTVSDASLLAPEEVYAPKKKPLKGETELTSDEKKANRRAKKTAKRKQKKADEADKKVIEKLNPGLGNKYTKQAAIDNLNQLRKAKVIIIVIVDFFNILLIFFLLSFFLIECAICW